VITSLEASMQKPKPVKRPKRNQGYIIALGKDRKTVFVAGRAVAKRSPALWKRLAMTKGVPQTTMTFVVPDKPTLIMMAGTILWPPKVL
jgi:hypothetical protein